MFAGEITSFHGDRDEPEVEENVLIEVTDWGQDPQIEIATDVGKKRIYLRFRLEDLKREIKEKSAS